jgi:xanthine dehydrogenase accessory factor
VDWLGAVTDLRTRREAGVLVTLASVRGHAPREAGAKMVVSAGRSWGSIGGGNLEAVAVDRARAMLLDPTARTETFTSQLSDKAPAAHGVQCCGGEVTVLLELLAVRPAVAIFGVGHVGWELARILARHDLDLHLVDSRSEQLAPERLAVLDDAQASVHAHPVPMLPELVLGELPRGCHVLVLTHDHAEDAALVDAALRLVADDASRLATIGLIGSPAKWTRFRIMLLREGHAESALERVTTPIGLPRLAGKEPAAIAVGVAAQLLEAFQERAAAPGHLQSSPAPAQERAAAPGHQRSSPTSARR